MRSAALRALARYVRAGSRGLGAAMAMLLCLIGPARAEDGLTLATSPAQRCLFPPEDKRVKPDYPADMLRLKRDAQVRVELVFTAPDQPPDINFEGDAPDDFRVAVKVYARQLRVPCMKRESAPVKLRQIFDFTPNDGRKVAWSTPVDEANPRRKELLACIVKPASASEGGIFYPDVPLRERREGNVVVRLHFVDRDKAPVAEILDNGGSKYFAQAISGYIDSMRMPCLEAEPVEVQFVYQFMIDNAGKRRVLNDLSLAQFLHAAKPIPPGSVFFDTTSMSCPFDVRLTFEQPWSPNRVEELDEDVPARHALLDWLATQQLDLSPKEGNALLGQQMNVHIPCARIDL